MAPEKGTNPGTIDLTTPEYAAKCGMCHPGGGPMEKDRQDNFLHIKSLEEIESLFDTGTIPGDYSIWSPSEKKFVPFEWKTQVGSQTINNTMAPACFLCHSKLSSIPSHNGILRFRVSVKKLKYFSGADTAASGLATLDTSTKLFSYNATFDTDPTIEGIQISDNVIGPANDQHCSQCHGGGWDDVDENGAITPMDFVLQTKDIKFLQPDFMKEAKVWFSNKNITDEKGIPKNVEVHQWEDYIGSENVKGCVSCHQPVSHDYIGSGYFPDTTVLTPSHDFAKGNAGPAHGVMWHQLAGSAKCENCHTDAVDKHKSVMGPAAETHMERIACTTCHIGKKYFYRIKLIDWSLPLWVVSGNNSSITFLGLTKNGYLYGDPANGTWSDVAWFPQKDFNTGEVTWKLKSVNAMGIIYFEDNSQEEFKPVFARYLVKAFRLSTQLPTKYIIKKVDSNGNPVREGTLGHLVMKVKKGTTIASDSDLATGEWIVAYAIPNYIDVNQNGLYDEEVDVPINDDTGLTGSPDGTPEINTKEEVEAAIDTLEKIISAATGKEVDVKLVTSTDAFAMTHNIRPASEALQCADCHGRAGDSALSGTFFTRTTPLYFEYEPEVTTADYFDQRIPRIPSETEYADRIREELVKLGYSAEGEMETSAEESTTSETETSTTSGGGGGCSISTAGAGGGLSALLTLLSLGFLRFIRRKGSN